MNSGYQKSDHYDGSVYFNPNLGPQDKSFLDFLKWKFGGESVAWPERVEIRKQALPPLANPDELSVTFVNHATFLIRSAKHTILVDPIWSERCSPFSMLGPKRVHEPGIAWEDLPKVDLVLISHNHYDHLDLRTLKRLKERDDPLFIMPLGNKALLKTVGLEDRRLRELDWWEAMNLDGLEISLLPAQHWSARGLFDRNKALWGGYGLKFQDSGLSLYHAGDTGYGALFKEIRKRWGKPHLALLPIGAYAPQWFHQVYHMNPEEAAQAFRDLEADEAIGMHFGTFQLTDESREEPMERLRKLAVPAFHLPEPGQSFRIIRAR